MLKHAWRSYLASLHPRYLRKAYDAGLIFPLLYWMVIYPTMMMLVNKENTLELYQLMAHMYMRMIPFFIMEWSNVNSKYLMTKKMYLSPMKETEREEYIKQVLFIKIGMTILLGVCIDFVWGMFNGFHLGKIFVMMVANLSIGIAAYISFTGLGKTKSNTKNHWANNVATIMAIFIMVAIGILEVGADESLALVCNWYIVVAVMVLLILDVVIVRKEYRATIVLAGNYELAFKIKAKEEPKQVTFDLFAKK